MNWLGCRYLIQIKICTHYSVKRAKLPDSIFWRVIDRCMI
jgi:hypothetical protein